MYTLKDVYIHSLYNLKHLIFPKRREYFFSENFFRWFTKNNISKVIKLYRTGLKTKQIRRNMPTDATKPEPAQFVCDQPIF
jgi:hypothetical protein